MVKTCRSAKSCINDLLFPKGGAKGEQLSKYQLFCIVEFTMCV